MQMRHIQVKKKDKNQQEDTISFKDNWKELMIELQKLTIVTKDVAQIYLRLANEFPIVAKSTSAIYRGQHEMKNKITYLLTNTTCFDRKNKIMIEKNDNKSEHRLVTNDNVLH